MSHHGTESFGRYLLRPPHVAIIIGISVLTLLFEHWGWLNGFETAGLDSILIFKKPHRAEYTTIVEITDDDYETLFHASSPLDPSVLADIIRGVALAHPRAIGVDIDTSAPAFRSLRDLQSDVPIVWAQPAWPTEPPARAGLLRQVLNPFARGGELVATGDVLGAPAGDQRTGIALMPLDQDGIVRRYLRRLSVMTGDGGRQSRESFPTALLRASGHVVRGPPDEVVLNFPGNRFALNRMPASLFRELALDRAAAGDAWTPPAFLAALAGRIVLIGGSYRAARDEYVTPLGPMGGVELVAVAIESELGGGIRSAADVMMIAFDVLAACLVLYVCYRFRLKTAFILGLVVIPVLAMAGSYLVFSSLAYWISFAPVLVGVLVHQVYHHAVEYHSLYQAAEQTRGDLGNGT